MAKGRVKKYVQSAIPTAISEKGGFTARFIGDGFSVDARTEILPKVIKEQGLQIGEEPGWALVYSFLKECANHAASTGETVNVDSLMTFGLSIRGWFENKTSKAKKENVRVTAKLLGDLKPTVNFSMSNANEGNTLTIITVMSPGCKLDEVKQGATATINGKWLKMIIDGSGSDHVKAEVKLPGGQKVGAECPILGSDDDHIEITIPGEFGGEDLVGKEIVFTVFGRTGDPEAGVQSATIAATLIAGEPVPEPLVTSQDGLVKVMSIDENPVPALGDFTVRGENVGYKSGDPDHGLMGALATVAGQQLSWHCSAYDDDHAPEATFVSDGSADELPPGEYIAALTLNYAVDDGTGVSHLEPLVIENVKFKVSE